MANKLVLVIFVNKTAKYDVLGQDKCLGNYLGEDNFLGE